jgi:transposase-like protein
VNPKAAGEKAVKDIRRATRKRHSAEEKIAIVLAGLRGEDSIAELCRREGIAQSLYYSWSKEFLEAGKKRLGATWRGRRRAGRSRTCGPRRPRSRRPWRTSPSRKIRVPALSIPLLRKA